MRIKLPVAAPVSYNPAYYLEKAFRALGHEADVLDQDELYHLAVEDVDYLCAVDSGGPLNIPEQFLPKTSMWFIDSRRNSSPEIRNPDDDTVAMKIIEGGGIVYQAQLDDIVRLSNRFVGPKIIIGEGLVWVPLAADVDVWSDQPEKFISDHVLSFVGNCYDPIRMQIIEQLTAGGVLHWPGHGGAIMEDGAEVYRSSVAGLNIPSWLGTPECYDVNMRVFEILSCGIPLITNKLPDLERVNIHPDCYFGYNVPEDLEGKELVAYITEQIVEITTELIQNPQRAQEMGKRARETAVEWNTYTHRARLMLRYFERRNGNESR